MTDQPDDQGPDLLSLLPDNEAQVLDGVLRIINATIADQDLRENLIGAILDEVEDWAERAPKVQ